MRINAALKKRYKYLYLNNVFSFYELEPETRAMKKDARAWLGQGAAEVDYVNPAHSVGAKNYVKASWDAITTHCILNFLIKTELCGLG